MIKVNEVTRVNFLLGGKKEGIPTGRACLLTEDDGAITVAIRYGHAHPDLCRDLDEYHQQLLGAEGRWAQTWGPEGVDRVYKAPEGLGLAHVAWRIVPARELPERLTCMPLEVQGRFAWVIRSGLATPRLCDEMNEYLTRITGDGLWVQRWRGGNPLHN